MKRPLLDIVSDRRPQSDEAVRRLLDARFPRGRIARVLLVNPPDGDARLFRLETARRGRYHNYPPYGLTLLAAQLRAIGVEIRIVNLNHEMLVAATACDDPATFDFDATWQRQLDAAIEEFAPDLVGVTCMFTMTHASFRAVCTRAARGGLPIAIGGVHVSNDVERVLDDVGVAEFAFLREADTALPTFCRVVAGEEPVSALGQLIVRDGETRHRFLADCRPTVEQFDILPAFDAVELVALARHGMVGVFDAFLPKNTPSASCLSNRGCRARCTFCSVSSFNGRVVRQRPVESVLDELGALAERGVRHVVWLDDDLLKDHDRALALFRGIVDRKLELTFDATNGLIAASCNDEMVAAMDAAGFVGVNIGMESGNPSILRQIRKPGTVDVFLRAAEVFRRHPNIHARVLLMIGFPDETLSMIEDTLEVALRMNLDWYAITPLQPLPNTPIYDAMVAQGMVTPVDGNLTFMGGGYGRQDKIDESGGAALAGFRHAFHDIPLDAVPTPDQIHDIWFYMYYHLNFHRLYREDRPAKQVQILRHLANLSSKVSPEHALALYFAGYLQLRTTGSIDPQVVTRLRAQLAASTYWRTRFAAFGMSADDLVRGEFPNADRRRLSIRGGTVSDGRAC